MIRARFRSNGKGHWQALDLGVCHIDRVRGVVVSQVELHLINPTDAEMSNFRLTWPALMEGLEAGRNVSV